ncbi:MAG: Ig-like domain-containing protein [Planctomycetota bacterium]|nr:MAG: Ig-like domain-containing protein [Planctomycetota bacterium]
MKRSALVLATFLSGSLLISTGIIFAWTPLPVADDPLVRMPGTQPDQGVNLEAPNRCLNCHGGYDTAVEPGFNWKGSMMAQAARDFLYFACLTVAAQDSIWAAGRPNAVDICERCHFPAGWLGGRSDPPNASAMIGSDFDGVHCDFCHTKYDPFYETTFNGTREGSDWLNYWDETNASGTPSQPAADGAYLEDSALAQAISLFNGSLFYTNNLPPANYDENGSGQYFVSTGSQKRAPFADAAARHQMIYSRYHKSKYFCGTCHDVSNPVLGNFGQDGTQPLTTETDSAYSYLHVERTFSEFRLSAYGQQDGAAGMGPFDPTLYQTSHPDNNIRMCQDCHMRDVVGVGCNKQGVPIRPNESIEHPKSGQPLHDMTGGNAWVSWVLASSVPGSPSYDSVNDQLINQGPAVLTLDTTQGQGIDPVALLAGVDRAKQQLLLAASIQNLSYNSATGAISFQVQNQTGHKLISGFPEGRRMFVNIKFSAGGSPIYEVNPYDYSVGTLKGLPHSPNSPALGPDEAYVDELVYEMHPTSAITQETETFHFALATGRYKDNRIPPKGFRIAEAAARISVPVWHGVEDPNYYTADEYAGGYDDVSLTLADAAGADYVEVNLYYQTTSREYIEFLRDEIKGTGNLTLYGPDNPLTLPDGLHNQTFATEIGLNPDNDNAYQIQDPSQIFFAQLRAWGQTIWDLWVHNMNVDGAKPFLMAQATDGQGPTCTPPVPTLLSADPGNQQVALSRSDLHSGDPNVIGYNVYYDQAGKAQLVAQLGLVTSFIDTGLTNGIEYCYKVTSYYVDCESAFSNILCAIPTNQGQTTDPAGVASVETGIYTGKGKTKTFNLQSSFNAGDAVVFRAHVVDDSTGQPLANATVELLITGPETATLTTGPSDASGVAEATWQTKAPGKRNPGTTPGGYTVQTKNVTATGYHWDGIMTSATFSIQ